MKYSTSLSSIITRGASCLIILFVLFVRLGPPASAEAEMLNFIFLTLASILAVPLTMIICIIVGLPIRLVPKIYRFWMKYPFIAFIGIVIGICILVLSFHPFYTNPKTIHFEVDNKSVILPDEDLFTVSWFTITFFLLHFYPVAFFNYIFSKFKLRKSADLLA